MKEEMIEFLNNAQIPLYFEEKKLIREFIETYFNHHQPERLNPEDASNSVCDSLSSIEI